MTPTQSPTGARAEILAASPFGVATARVLKAAAELARALTAFAEEFPTQQAAEDAVACALDDGAYALRPEDNPLTLLPDAALDWSPMVERLRREFGG